MVLPFSLYLLSYSFSDGKREVLEKMGCKRKFKRIRAKDVGRPGHHYIKVGVKKTKGPRGGRTEKIGKLRKYKNPKKK